MTASKRVWIGKVVLYKGIYYYVVDFKEETNELVLKETDSINTFTVKVNEIKIIK